MNSNQKPYLQEVAEVIESQGTNQEQGLSHDEIEKRLRAHGYNELPPGTSDSWLLIFIHQFQNPLIYILLVAAAIIFVVGDSKLDAFIICGVLFFNAIIGTIQEGRTKNIIESLRRFIKTQSVVIRDGKKEVIEDRYLVPGDVIILQEGQRVPADARVILSVNMSVDESALTGESMSVRKGVEKISGERPVADRENMVYKGTYVMGGHGKAVVIGIGVDTEIGAIHQTVDEIKTDIPLKVELERLSYFILLFILAMCVFLLMVGLLHGKPAKELLVMLTALFICVVPEGLPVVLTLVLANGAYKMAQRNVLVKNLQAVDALGRCDVIVIDKTGTLTRNEMLVSAAFADDKSYQVTGQGYYSEGAITSDGTQITPAHDSALWHMGIAASLLNTAEISYVQKLKIFEVKGDPTEAAMFVFSQKLGIDAEALLHEYQTVFEIPFDPQNRFHAGFFRTPSSFAKAIEDKQTWDNPPILPLNETRDRLDERIKYVDRNHASIYITGSPEFLLNLTVSPELIEGHSFKAELDELLAQGLRVVAVGMKEIPLTDLHPDCTDKQECLERYKKEIKDIKILGFLGIQDSIRSEVQGVLAQARRSGIRVIMATGDHKSTALYVAKKAGLFAEGDLVLDGSEFHRMSDAEVLAQLDKTTVYSRVSPTDKLRIINLFHIQKNIVAMTGDGINDAPSLVAADLGIAMGGIGTEVAKQAADIVLLDDSFVSIMNGVEQGRHIFYTLRRVILYFFTTNMGEVLIVFFAMFTFLPLPLTAPQILWLNLVTDGFLDVALAAEPKEQGLLEKSWLQQKLRLVDASLLYKMMFVAVPMGAVSLGIFAWDLGRDGLAHARTMTLITMAMFQWFNAWNCRSERLSILQSGLFTNKWLLGAMGLVLGLQLFILHVPFMQYIFKTVPLSLADWGIILAVTFPIILLEEGRKFALKSLNPFEKLRAGDFDFHK